MSAPSFAKFPGQVQTQGAYPWDPRNVVGADNSRYATKEEIPLVDRFIGLQVLDASTGKLWMLIGGTANEDYLDILGLFVTLASANQANGYAALDVNGKLSNSVIPALAIGDTFVVANQTEMLATGAEIGDIAKRTDEGKTYVLQGADPTVLGNWVDISSNFAGGVETVNGKSGTNITLNQDEVPDGSTYKRVTQAEKNSWDGKQPALGYDTVPTFGSNKFILSGPLFDYLKTIQSSINQTSWLGSEADGNNRFYIDEEAQDIDKIIFVTEGGVHNHEGVHFTVDAEKRYIEWNEDPDATKTYYLKYLSNIPVVSLTSVSVENVNGLLEGGKVKTSLLPTIASAGTDISIDNSENGLQATNSQEAVDELAATKLGVGDLDVSDIEQGEKKILTVTKNVSDQPQIGDAILLIDRYAPNALLAQLDPANAWVNFERTLTGPNSTGALGETGQTIVATREKYDCVASNEISATWRIRFNSDTLEAAYSQRHADIITELQTEAGWNNNFKVINTINCFQGESFFDNNEEGYMYVCLEQSGTSFVWKRMAHTPDTLELYFTSAEKGTLVTALQAHDFDTNGWYDQSGLSAGDQAEVGRRYVDTANERVYEVVTTNLIARVI